MIYTATIQESHYNQLKDHLLKKDGNERVAFIICGRSLLPDIEERFLSREVIILNDDQITMSLPNKVSWDNNSILTILKRAESKNYGIILVHNHPKGYNNFSSTDDEGETGLFNLVYNRNGGERPHGSIVLMPDGSMFGRAWTRELQSIPFSMLRVIGENIKFQYPGKLDKFKTPEIFHRQQLAFGSSLIQDLSKLKCSIVGAGATGSATANLLARLGVGEINIIDKDVIEESNLNRLHGAGINDVGKYKVDVLKKHIDNFGLGVKINTTKDWISSNEGIENLKSSDLIFGCTDDNAGRIILNRFAYFYLVPVIDMGLVISVKNDPPEIQDLQGRVSYLFPGGDCLITKGIINIDRAYSENLKRSDPVKYESLKKEAYVLGEGNPAPAVITFTTLIASMAVNEFINRIQAYNPNGKSAHKIHFFHRGIELNPANLKNNECRICGNSSYWGRGDMIPMLDIVI